MTGIELVERKGLPECNDIERWTLGAILSAANPSEMFQLVAQAVNPEDFGFERHRILFAAMYELDSAGTAVDRGTIYTMLQNRGNGDMERIGGLSGMLDLEDGYSHEPGLYGTHSNIVAAWTDTIREKSALRRLIAAFNGGIMRAMAGDSSEAILAHADKVLAGIADSGPESEWRNPNEIMASYPGGWQGMIDPKNGGLMGLSMPWTKMSEELCGLKAGELILIGARPGMGKSIFGMQTALHAVKYCEVSAAVFSIEMTGEELVKRAIASEGRVDSHLMRHGQLTGHQKGMARAAVVTLSDLPLYIDQRPHSTFSIRLAVKRLQRKLATEGKPPLGLIVVDHFHLLSPLHPREDPRQMFNRSADDLMRIAKEFGLPVVALCQLSRKCEDEQREPTKADLAETGKLEQNAHVIILLHRPEVYPKFHDREDLKNMAYAIVAKQRSGPVGTHDLVFLKAHQRFEEAFRQFGDEQ